MPRRGRSLLLVLMMGSLSLPVAGCTQVEEYESTYSPTTVEPIKGRDDDMKRVTFTREAAQRADLKTDKVRATGGHTSMPYAALIYDEEGLTYAYVSPKPLVFVREPVDIQRIAGDRVVLRDGPPAGTTVVTTGAPEVYSAEFGVEE
jgi:multidrug efflux pump subunit AcrA (membrane-fusion protein)